MRANIKGLENIQYCMKEMGSVIDEFKEAVSENLSKTSEVKIKNFYIKS